MKRKVGAFELDLTAWWIWGAIGLVVILGVIFVLKGKGSGALNYLRQLLGG